MNERLQLPVFNYRLELLKAIEEHRAVLVRGETGCGKTTQIPQFVLDSFILNGCGALCNVVVTQPRRISAISIAERVAAERGEQLGCSVGYSVRFESVLPRCSRCSYKTLVQRSLLLHLILYSIRFSTFSTFVPLFCRPFGSIMYCTVGTLLRRMENGLRGVSHVFHERDINVSTSTRAAVLHNCIHV